MYTVAEIYIFLSTWLLATPRALGMFLVLPFAGKSFLPGMTRNALLIGMTVILVPLLREQLNDIPSELGGIIFMALKEVFLGFVLGFIFSLPFWAMDSVGSMIDRQRGVMSGEASTPISASPTTILGNALSLYTIALLFSSGGFYFLFDTFLTSYKIWPVTSFYPTLNSGMGIYFLMVFDSLMYLILLIAGPVLAVIFLVDLGFGFLNRSVPQINVFVLSLPVKGIASILILSLFMVKFSEYLKTLFFKYEASFRELESLFK